MSTAVPYDVMLFILGPELRRDEADDPTVGSKRTSTLGPSLEKIRQPSRLPAGCAQVRAART